MSDSKKSTNKDCIIVDIDGTVADCDHRVHLIRKKPKDWKKFLSPKLVRLDKPIASMTRLVHTLALSYPIVYVTGRPDSLRETTIEWLSFHELWCEPFALHMRAKQDYRQDTIVKKEILVELRSKGWNPWLSLEDRPHIATMWKEQGLTCLLVAEMDQAEIYQAEMDQANSK